MLVPDAESRKILENIFRIVKEKFEILGLFNKKKDKKEISMNIF